MLGYRTLPLAALLVLVATACAPAAVVPPPVPAIPGESGRGASLTVTLGQLGYLGYFSDPADGPSPGATVDVYASKTLKSGGQFAGWASVSSFPRFDAPNGTLYLQQWPFPAGGLLYRRPLGEFQGRDFYAEFGAGTGVVWLGLPLSRKLRPGVWTYTDPTLALGFRSLARVPLGIAKTTPGGDRTTFEVSAGVGWGIESWDGFPWSFGVGFGYEWRSPPTSSKAPPTVDPSVAAASSW